MKFTAFFYGVLLCGMPVCSAIAADQKDCRLTRYSEIPVSTLPDGRFTVPITLEGQALNFLVDTGGTIATVTPGQAYNLQLQVKRSDRVLEGVAGSRMATYADVRRISLGGIEGGNLAVYIDPELPAGADGTLAPDMMKHFDVDLDLMHGKLNLFSQKHCKGQVVYWTKSGYVVLPMQLASDGHIQVPVILDGIKLNALLDTGARDSIVSMRAIKALGISEKSPELKSVTDAKSRYKMYEYPFKQLDFDGVGVKNPHVLIASDDFLPGRDTDMIVGISILRQLHLYIAYDEEELYITPATAN